MQKVRRHPPPPRGEGRAPTACGHPVSGSVSPRSSRCFSPFPHGTGSLSVTEEYLGLEGGPPTFRQDGSCPALLEDSCSDFPYGAVTRSKSEEHTSELQSRQYLVCRLLLEK